MVDEKKTKKHLLEELKEMRIRIGELEHPPPSRQPLPLEQPHQQAEKAQAFLAAIVESTDDAIIGETLDGIVLSWNAGAEKIYGYTADEIIGKPISHLVPSELQEEVPQMLKKIGRGERIDHCQTIRLKKNGEHVQISLTLSPIKDPSGVILGASLITRDITDLKQAEERLRTAHDELEKRVKIRTKELAAQSRRLQELNAALRALLTLREEDRVELEEAILSNLRNLVFPYTEKLRRTRLDSDQMACLTILQSHLENISSQFTRRLSQGVSGLTPTEVTVAGLVREGRTTKEIADLLSISDGTVAFHRNNLRQKLGLKSNGLNLKSYLQSLR